MNLNTAVLGLDSKALYSTDTSKASKTTGSGDFLSLVLGVSSVKGSNPVAAVSVSGDAGLSESEAKQVLQAVGEIAGEILNGQNVDVAGAIDGLSDDGKQAVLMLLQGLLSQIVSGGDVLNTESSLQTDGEGIFNSVFGEISEDGETSGLEKLAKLLAEALGNGNDDKASKDVLAVIPLILAQVFAAGNEVSENASNALQSENENAVLKIGEVQIPLAVSQSKCAELLAGAISEIKAEIYPQNAMQGQNAAVQNTASTVLTDEAAKSSSAEQASFLTGIQPEAIADNAKVLSYRQNASYYENSVENPANAVEDSASLKLISEGNTAKTVAVQKINDKKDELEEIGINTEAAKAVTPLENTDVQVKEGAKADEVKNFDTNQIVEKAKAQITTLKTGEKAEMTMTLNPESLGEITLKLQNDGGKVSVLIAAHSEATQKLLQERLPDLVSSLSQVNSGVEDVKVVSMQESQYAGLGFGGSGFGGEFGNNRPQRNEQAYYGTVTTEKTSSEENDETEFRGGSRLWQTA